MNQTTPMNPEVKAEWLDALRSDNYAQGRGMLRSQNNDFCCLGVLCDLAERKGIVKSERPIASDRFVYGDPDLRSNGISGLLPSAVQVWAGITSSDGQFGDDQDRNSLADQNDKGKTFEEIADLIERYF